MSFLTQKYGPLPAWGWGAVAGGGLLVAKMAGSGGRQSGHGNDPSGHLTGEAEAQITAGQNTGAVSAVTDFGYGPSDSRIDGSFFGNEMLDHSGPMSIGADIRGYVDIFPQGMHGHRHHHHGPGEIYGNDNVPSGAGGVGTHRARWYGEAPPAGGEGYQNYGQSTGPHKSRSGRPIGLNYREHRGGGGPHAQKTTMGTPLNTYMSQHGDTMDNVANKMWGPGQNGTLIHQANPGIAHTPQSEMHAGHHLKIPSAPPVGLAPSGVAGNGVGSGAWKQSTRSRMTSAGLYDVGQPQAEELSSAGIMGARPKPGKSGHGKRGGRGIQKGR